MMLWFYVHSIKEFLKFEQVKTIVILVKEEICTYNKSFTKKTAKYPSHSTKGQLISKAIYSLPASPKK